MTTMLPAKPKAFGNLRHVFKSSIASVSAEAAENPLGFGRAKAVTVVFIDGLGLHQIKARSGHSRWFASQTGAGYSVFPSTTACGITSFATGLWPGEHGIIGHQIYDRALGLGGNMLTGWGDQLNSADWQLAQPLSTRVVAAGIELNVIAHSEYRGTGFSDITMRDADFHPVDDLQSRFDKALQLSGSGVNYLYIAELDKLAHRYGWQSKQWADAYEGVAVATERFVAARGDMAVVVTADHGLLDTEPSRRIFLAQALNSVELEYFGGDTRVSYLYLRNIDVESLSRALEPFAHALSVHAFSELIEAGYLGELRQETLSRLPDFVLLAKSNYTLFHENFSKPRSSEMIAHHGGLTPAEIQIPIFRFGV